MAMQTKKLLVFLFLGVTLGGTCLFTAWTTVRESANSVIDPVAASDGFKTATYTGFTVKWRVSGPTLDVKVSYPTTGWVGVGFLPTTRMLGANIIMGSVSGSSVSISDRFGASSTGEPVVDGQDNITNKTGTETSGVTEISFSIPMDSPDDEQDKDLIEGNTITVILGASGSDSFSSQHSKRSTIQIVL
ncbi:MAG: hypothetical protein ACI9BD_001192 [Candidatus Marinamargulisbacteria bacterium]|jgi:hypothetical protein